MAYGKDCKLFRVPFEHGTITADKITKAVNERVMIAEVSVAMPYSDYSGTFTAIPFLDEFDIITSDARTRMGVISDDWSSATPIILSTASLLNSDLVDEVLFYFPYATLVYIGTDIDIGYLLWDETSAGAVLWCYSANSNRVRVTINVNNATQYASHSANPEYLLGIHYYTNDWEHFSFGLLYYFPENNACYQYDISRLTTSSDPPRLSRMGSLSDNTGAFTAFWDGAKTDYKPKEPEIITDPYAEAGQTGEGGGNGDVDNVSEPVDIPNLPTISATDTGLVSLFAPTSAQLKSLANYLWSGAFDLDSFRKIFADPMDCILGLSILPVAINTHTQRVLSVGNISTGITMDFVESQYVEIDCGSLNVNEYFGAYLDYSPYTKAEIYLPYIGIRPLAIDDIMNKTVKVVYHIDLLSGTCTAFVKADQSVIYSFIGQCSIEIPVTSVNYGNMITGALNIAGSIGSMVATGGMSAPMALGSIAATATNSMKPDVEKSGAYSGGGGLLGVQFPYLIVTRPRAAIPVNQNKYIGYPGFMTKQVGNLSGYTEFEEIHLENIPATNEELAEIERIMKEGVLL